MSRKLEKPRKLPEGLLWKKKWRRVLRTTRGERLRCNSIRIASSGLSLKGRALARHPEKLTTVFWNWGFWKAFKDLTPHLWSSTIIPKCWNLPHGLHRLIQNPGTNWVANVTQTWETLEIARRATLKEEMEENASHHLWRSTLAGQRWVWHVDP